MLRAVVPEGFMWCGYKYKLTLAWRIADAFCGRGEYPCWMKSIPLTTNEFDEWGT